MRLSLLLIGLAGLSACQSNTRRDGQTQHDTVATRQDTVAKTEASHNFFVVTAWATTDRNKAMAHVPTAQKQLMGLFDKGLVENIYYNQKGKFTDGQPLSLIGFFIKGMTEAQAHQLLDTTDIVRNNLANYSLHLVGENIFGRNENAMKMSGTGTEAYAVVWAFLVKRGDVDTKILDEQTKMTARLENEGIIENGYVDLRSLSANAEGIQPAVYFINARSEQEARKLLDSMPLVVGKQAVYGLHHVGQFMAGTKNK